MRSADASTQYVARMPSTSREPWQAFRTGARNTPPENLHRTIEPNDPRGAGRDPNLGSDQERADGGNARRERQPRRHGSGRTRCGGRIGSATPSGRCRQRPSKPRQPIPVPFAIQRIRGVARGGDGLGVAEIQRRLVVHTGRIVNDFFGGEAAPAPLPKSAATCRNSHAAPDAATRSFSIDIIERPNTAGSTYRVGKVGWGAWIRTRGWRNQNPLPYRLATPQDRCRRGPGVAAGYSGGRACWQRRRGRRGAPLERHDPKTKSPGAAGAFRFRAAHRSACALYGGWSEWQDSNLRPPAPEAGALPGCATLRPPWPGV